MPYKMITVPAELFFTHKGINVYHCYEDDDIQSGPREYYYVLNEDLSEEDSFDVRDLSTWTEPPHPPYLSLSSLIISVLNTKAQLMPGLVV